MDLGLLLLIVLLTYCCNNVSLGESNDGSSCNAVDLELKLLVVRHSQRLDDIDFHQWRSIVDKYSGPRKQEYLLGDTPITQGEGEAFAKEAGETIRRLILEAKKRKYRSEPTVRVSIPTSDNEVTQKCGIKYGINNYHSGIDRDNVQDVVTMYSSRLTRSVQTAHFISNALSPLIATGKITGNVPFNKIPIHVSSGISQVMTGVRSRPAFEFPTFDELRDSCTSYFGGGRATAIDPPILLDANDKSHPNAVCTTRWHNALRDSLLHMRDNIACTLASTYSLQNNVQHACYNTPRVRAWIIVVAHREMIHEMVQEFGGVSLIHIPYCSMALFVPQINETLPVTVSYDWNVELSRNGHPIEQNKVPWILSR